jgi:hypothetical protein
MCIIFQYIHWHVRREAFVKATVPCITWSPSVFAYSHEQRRHDHWIILRSSLLSVRKRTRCTASAVRSIRRCRVRRADCDMQHATCRREKKDWDECGSVLSMCKQHCFGILRTATFLARLRTKSRLATCLWCRICSTSSTPSASW